MRGAAAALILIVLGFPAAAAQAPSVPDGKVIPSERCRGLWIVRVSFGPASSADGSPKVLEMILDTGASSTSVDPDSVERVFGKKVRAGKRITLKDGEAGPLKLHRLPARTHEMDHLGGALGRKLDGILGFPTFKDLLLTIDYPHNEIRVERGRLPAVDGRTIFEDHGKRRPFIALEVGGTKVPVLIDTGSSGGLTLREEDVASWAAGPRFLGASVRFSKIVLRRSGRMEHDARLGPLTLPRPTVALTRETRLAGAEVLQHLVLVFDKKSDRIGIRLAGASSRTSPPIRGTGAALAPTGGGFEVVRVFGETPAEAAGLREGDLITAIDGKSLEEQGCERPTDDPARERVRFTVSREGEVLEVDVGIADLVP